MSSLRIRVMALPLEWGFVCLYFFFGLLFIYYTPPFQVPDEPHHFYRAYQVSTGVLISEKKGNFTGGEMPINLVKTVESMLQGIPFHPNKKFQPNSISKCLDLPIKSSETTFVEFQNSTIISPVPYIPQVTGIMVGKLFTDAPIGLFYMGRVANLFFSGLLIFFAIRLTPVFKDVFFLIAMLPMQLFLAASLSPDGLTIGLVFLIIALIFKQRSLNTPISQKTFIAIVCISILITLSKSVYFPVPLLLFTILWHNNISKTYYYQMTILFFTIVIFFLIWSKVIETIYSPTPIDPNIFPTIPHAFEYIFENPFYFISVMFRSLLHYFPQLILGFVGILGWTDFVLPLPLILAGYLVILYSAFTEETTLIRMNSRFYFTVLLTITSVSFLIFLSQFVIWTVPGAHIIGGIQGRYFLPIGPLFFILFCIPKERKPRKTQSNLIPYAFVCLCLCITLIHINSRYYA